MAFLSGFEKIVRPDEPLAMHTWLQLGGPAEYFAEPENLDQLIELIRRAGAEGLDVRLLGQGSNVLVNDDGVPGLVVKLSTPEFCKMEIVGCRITAGGGALLSRVVTTSVHSGLAGLEMLIGIPGAVGGALHGNSGSHGGDVGQWTAGATVVTATGEIHQRGRDDMAFGYRQSSLDDLVILEANFHLEEDDPRELTRRMQKLWIVKKASQPMGHQMRRLRLQESPRGQRRRLDREGRTERRPHRRGRGQRPPRQFHPCRTGMHRAGRAPLDRHGPQPGPRPDGRRSGAGNRGLVTTCKASSFNFTPTSNSGTGGLSDGDALCGG